MYSVESRTKVAMPDGSELEPIGLAIIKDGRASWSELAGPYVCHPS